ASAASENTRLRTRCIPRAGAKSVFRRTLAYAVLGRCCAASCARHVLRSIRRWHPRADARSAPQRRRKTIFAPTRSLRFRQRRLTSEGFQEWLLSAGGLAFFFSPARRARSSNEHNQSYGFG